MNIMKSILLLIVFIMSIGTAISIYESTEDTNNDAKTDAWYADTDDNMQYDRWNYDTNYDGKAEYYQYDLDGNCYAEYTNIIYPDTGSEDDINHWYADLDENGLYDRKDFDSNDDGRADVYTYDRDGDQVFEEIKVDSDFDYQNPSGPEKFDEWYWDTDADGIIDLCWYDANGDNNFSYAEDNWVNTSGTGTSCYNYSYDIPQTSNIVHNRWNWPCSYGAISTETETESSGGYMVSKFRTVQGELVPFKAGETAEFRINLHNFGDIDYKNTRFTVSVPELGIRAPRQIAWDFESEESIGKMFLIDIPEDTSPGEYMVRFHAYTEEGEKKTVHRIMLVQ